MSFSTSPHWESDLWTFWLPVGFSQAETIRKGVFSVFTAALLIVVKTCKRCNCPSTDEWIKMWCTHTIECYSAIRKNEIMPFATTWVDLEIIIGREEVRQEKTNTAWQHVHMESKLWRKWTHLRNRNRLRDRADLGLPRGGVNWRGMEWEAGDSRRKLLCIEWINKVLLYSTENYIQYAVINHNAIYF